MALFRICFLLLCLASAMAVKRKRNKRETFQTVGIEDDEDLASDYSTGGDLLSLEGRLDMSSRFKTSETKILLNGGLYVTFLKSDGTFEFHSIPVGSYVLEVDNRQLFFEPVRIDLSSRNVQATTISSQASLQYPLHLRPRGKFDYFIKRAPFNPLSILKQPTVLMMLFMAFMAFGLPKMMDQEALKESQKESQELMSSLMGGAKRKR